MIRQLFVVFQRGVAAWPSLFFGAPGMGALLWGGSVERNCEPMDKNRIEGAAEQSERAKFRKALVIKAERRKSGGCAVTECVLTRGDLA
jgi:hypothetical protein